MGNRDNSEGYATPPNSSPSRPKITYENGEFRHNGVRCRIVFRSNLISIGCTDITPDAVRKLWEEYESRFDTVVLQS